MAVGVSYHAGGCKCRVSLSDMDTGCVPPMVRCECWVCLSDMVLGCVPLMVRCKCLAGLSDMVHSMVRYKC